MELSELVPTASPHDWREWLMAQRADAVFGRQRCPFSAYLLSITAGSVNVYDYEERGRVACYRGGEGSKWFAMPAWAMRMVREHPLRETPAQVAARLERVLGTPAVDLNTAAS